MGIGKVLATAGNEFLEQPFKIDDAFKREPNVFIRDVVPYMPAVSEDWTR